MNVIESCHKCSSINTEENKSESVGAGLLKVAGYRSFCCKNCGYSWSQFLPMSTLLGLVYLFLAAEIGFLLLNYIH